MIINRTLISWIHHISVIIFKVVVYKAEKFIFFDIVLYLTRPIVYLWHKHTPIQSYPHTETNEHAQPKTLTHTNKNRNIHAQGNTKIYTPTHNDTYKTTLILSDKDKRANTYNVPHIHNDS